MVKENAAAANPATDADTAYVPAVPLAAGTGEIATPAESVTAVTEALPLNVALAPVEGPVNVTVIPATGFKKPSVTLA